VLNGNGETALALAPDVPFSCGDELKDRLLVAQVSCQNLGSIADSVRTDHIRAIRCGMDEEVEFAALGPTTSKDRYPVVRAKAVENVTRDHTRLFHHPGTITGLVASPSGGESRRRPERTWGRVSRKRRPAVRRSLLATAAHRPPRTPRKHLRLQARLGPDRCSRAYAITQPGNWRSPGESASPAPSGK
jgi:hypothetical protein